MTFEEFIEGAASEFNVYASDQIAMKSRVSTQKDKTACDTRAEVWNDAATSLLSLWKLNKDKVK